MLHIDKKTKYHPLSVLNLNYIRTFYNIIPSLFCKPTIPYALYRCISIVVTLKGHTRVIFTNVYQPWTIPRESDSPYQTWYVSVLQYVSCPNPKAF